VRDRIWEKVRSGCRLPDLVEGSRALHGADALRDHMLVGNGPVALAKRPQARVHGPQGRAVFGPTSGRADGLFRVKMLSDGLERLGK
jgi:hypothetical protein